MGGRCGVHHADLPAGGLGAQHDVLGHIEGILHIAGRVVFGHVEAGEVVVVVLDLGAFIDLEAHAGKHVDDLIFDEGDGVQPAGGVGGAGQRDVHGFGGVARGQFGRGDVGGEGFVHALGPDLAVVDELARRGAVLFGHVAQAFGQAGHGAVLAQVFLPEIGQLLLVVHGGTVGFELCAQGADLFFHCAPSFCFLPVAAGERSGRQQKKLRP